MKIEWIKGTRTNMTLLSPDKTFCISFDPMPLYNAAISWQSDNGSNETALCYDGKYFILNGDFRSDYEKIIDKGFNVCMKFYLSKRDKHISSHSSDFDEYIEEGR